MLFKIAPSQFAQHAHLLAPLDEHLCIAALLQGVSAGHIYADDPRRPSAALIDMGHRMFLTGQPHSSDFTQQLNTLLRLTVTRAKADGRDAFVLHLASPAWEAHMPAILAGLDPHVYPRQYFEATRLTADWRAILPDGFVMQPVDAALLDCGYANTDELRREMCSERSSVDDFLAHSFGACVVHQNALVSWCLSEYNTGERCEVGIATHPDYQRRRLGLAVALAMAETAFASGYRRIGWHCWKNNIPSARLAERAGYEWKADLPVWLCYWDAKPVRPTA